MPPSPACRDYAYLAHPAVRRRLRIRRLVRAALELGAFVTALAAYAGALTLVA